MKNAEIEFVDEEESGFKGMVRKLIRDRPERVEKFKGTILEKIKEFYDSKKPKGKGN